MSKMVKKYHFCWFKDMCKDHYLKCEGKFNVPPWWRHQMETFSALLAICAGNSPVSEFPAQRPVTRSFDVLFDLRLNKRLSKQSWGLWFETLSRPLWRHCNESPQLQCLTVVDFCVTVGTRFSLWWGHIHYGGNFCRNSEYTGQS